MSQAANSEQYSMPAEWAPHAATWIAWPHNAEDWPGKFQPIPWVYAEIVRHLSNVEDVHILVNNEVAEQRATAQLKRGGANLARTHFHTWPTDRVWLRDSGPIFVKNPQGDLAVTNWKFNAWAKYDNWRRDNLIPNHVANGCYYDIPEHCAQIELGDGKPAHRLVLEGGSIDTNGAGILMTTEECLLSEIQQRNPGLGDYEQTRKHLGSRASRQYLGIEKTIWPATRLRRRRHTHGATSTT